MRVQPPLKRLAVIFLTAGLVSSGGSQEMGSSGPEKALDSPQSSSSSRVLLGDYVPCLFNSDDQREMHGLLPAPIPPKNLDDTTAIQLYAATTAAIRQFSSRSGANPQSVQDFLTTFSQQVTPAKLRGLSPADAYAVIETSAQNAKQSISEKRELIYLTPQEIDAAAVPLEQAATETAKKITQAQTGKFDSSKAVQLFDETKKAIVDYAAKNGYNTLALQDFLAPFNIEATPRLLVGSTPAEAFAQIDHAVHRARLLAITRNIPLRNSAVGDTGDVRAIEEAATNVLQHVTEAASNVIQTKAAKPFKAPDDVSCSMSILTWKETSDIFGRRVANAYVAIQVTVRNLNNKNEFLIHDIQVAIDTGSEKFGRFQAGRDKLLVRGVAQRGQSEDRRNLVLHSLEAIGAILGSTSIAGSSDFESGVAVFQGAFIPGYSSIFPDHTVEQLNHINDLVFSASSSSKVLVPIQGSVPLVTFIAEKPIEQLPFAGCGSSKRSILMSKAYQICPLNQIETESVKFGTVPFRKWEAQALEILQRRTFVVLGGVHIQEIQVTPKLNNIDCPTLTSGPADLSLTSGTMTCSVTGGNLDRVTSVALERNLEKVMGKIKPAKDGNSATMSFDSAALSDLSGIYSVYFIDNVGAETDSGNSILLAIQPIINKFKETSLDLANPTLTLDGKHLDQINSAALEPDDGKTSSVTASFPSGQNSDGKSLSLTFSPAGLITGKQYHLVYSSKLEPGKQIQLKSVTIMITGTPVKN